ncbi:MAG: cytochrome P450 [Sporichthyaceae bacterium]
MKTDTVPATAVLDLFDPTFHHQRPEIAAARELHWWARTPSGIAVLRYAETAALLPDPRLHGGLLGFLTAQGVTAGPVYELVRDGISSAEGKDHVRLRRLIGKAFTPRAVEGMRPRVRALATELIDEFVTDGHCEFMEAFANRLPAAVTMDLLGVPAELQDRCSSSIADLNPLFSWNVTAELARVERGVRDLEATAADLIAARRRDPVDDLISGLVAAEDAGRVLTDRELQVLIVALLFAAQDTTRNQLGLAMVTFAEHPEQWALLAEDRDLGPAAAEETMRVNPTTPYLNRVAAVDFEHADVRVPAGTLITFVLAAANTDPRAFGTGGFDVTAVRTARQLAFGAGPHACLGMALARLELAEALPLLAARLGPIRIDGTPQWPGPSILYGPLCLPLAFDAPRGSRPSGSTP